MQIVDIGIFFNNWKKIAVINLSYLTVILDLHDLSH
jgi:hypothetical protein